MRFRSVTYNVKFKIWCTDTQIWAHATMFGGTINLNMEIIIYNYHHTLLFSRHNINTVHQEKLTAFIHYIKYH